MQHLILSYPAVDTKRKRVFRKQRSPIDFVSSDLHLHLPCVCGIVRQLLEQIYIEIGSEGRGWSRPTTIIPAMKSA